MSSTYNFKNTYKNTYKAPTFRVPTYQLPTYKNTYTPLTNEQLRYLQEYEDNLKQTPDKDWQKVLRRAEMTANTNDAKQLNSLADAISTAFAGTRFDNESKLSAWLLDNKLLPRNPASNMLAGVFNAFSAGKQFLIDPISEGYWGTAGINFLQGAMESLDILANPVKGAIIETYKNGPSGIITGLAKGFGYGNEGRTTYEYDTGNGFADFLLELATDPGFWASLGTSGLLKGVGKEGAEAIIGEGATTLVKEVASEFGEKTTRKWLKRGLNELVQKSVKGETATMMDAVESLLRYAPTSKVTADSVQELAEIALEFAQKGTKELQERIGYNIIKTIDTLDNSMTKTVFSPVYAPYKLINKVYKTYNTRVLRILDPYLEHKDILSMMDFKTVMSKTGELTNSLVYTAKSEGLEGLNNVSIQRAFLTSLKKDLSTIDKHLRKISDLFKNPEKFAAEWDLRHVELKNHLMKTHGFTEDMSIADMLKKYIEALKDAAEYTDLFKNHTGQLQTLIESYAQLETAFEFFKTLNKNVVNPAQTKALVDVLTNDSGNSLKTLSAQNLPDAVNLFVATYQSSLKDTAEIVYNAIVENNKLLTVYITPEEVHRNVVNFVMYGSNEAKAFLQNYLPKGKLLQDYIPEKLQSTFIETMQNNILADLITPVFKLLGLEDVLISAKYDIDAVLSWVKRHNQGQNTFRSTKFIENEIAKIIRQSALANRPLSYIRTLYRQDKQIELGYDISKQHIDFDDLKLFRNLKKDLERKGYSLKDVFKPTTTPRQGLREQDIYKRFNKILVQQNNNVVVRSFEDLTNVLDDVTLASLRDFVEQATYLIRTNVTLDTFTISKTGMRTKNFAQLTEGLYDTLKHDLQTAYNKYIDFQKQAIKENIILKGYVDKIEAVGINIQKEVANTMQKNIVNAFKKAEKLTKSFKRDVDVDPDDAINNIKTSITDFRNNLQELLDSFETTSFSPVFTAVQDDNIFLTDALQNAIKDLDGLLKADTPDANALFEVLHNLQIQCDINQSAIHKALNEGVRTTAVKHSNTYKRLPAFVYTKKATFDDKQRLNEIVQKFQDIQNEIQNLNNQIAHNAEQIKSLKTISKDFKPKSLIKDTPNKKYENAKKIISNPQKYADKVLAEEKKLESLQAKLVDLKKEKAKQSAKVTKLDKKYTDERIKNKFGVTEGSKIIDVNGVTKEVKTIKFNEDVPEPSKKAINDANIELSNARILLNRIQKEFDKTVSDIESIENTIKTFQYYLKNGENIVKNYEDSLAKEAEEAFIKDVSNLEEALKITGLISYEAYKKLPFEKRQAKFNEIAKALQDKIEELTNTNKTHINELKPTYYSKLNSARAKFEAFIEQRKINAYTNIDMDISAGKIKYPKEVVNEVFSKLEYLINNAYSLFETNPAEFSVMGTAIQYIFKQEQTANSIVYLTDDIAKNFIIDVALNKNHDIINKFTDAGYVEDLLNKSSKEEIKEAIKEMAEGCMLVYKGADSVAAYGQLLQTIESSATLTKKQKAAIISTLNRPDIAKLSVEFIARDPDYMFSKLFENIEGFINGVDKPRLFNLDAYREEKAVTQYFEKKYGLTPEAWAILAHHAGADTLTTKAFIEDVLDGYFHLRPNDIIWDSETSNLSGDVGEALEYSFLINDTVYTFKRHIDKANPDIVPEHDALLVYAKDEPDLNKALDKFYDYYNRDYSGPQIEKHIAEDEQNVIQYFDTEEDLLKAIFDFLHKNGTVYLDDTGKNIDKTNIAATRLVGHNSINFDIEFLEKRAVKRGLENDFKAVFNRFDHIDTLKLAEEKYNYTRLTAKDKATIQNLFKDYIVSRTIDYGTGVWHAGEDFVNAIPKELSRGLKQISGVQNDVLPLVDPTRGNGVAILKKQSASDKKYLKELLEKEAAIKRGEIPEEVYSADFSVHTVEDEFYLLRKHLTELRKQIRETNKQLNNVLFTIDDLESPAFKELIFNILKDSPTYKGWTEAQLREYLKYVNPSKLLYSEYDLYNLIGFKKVFDPKAVRAWFKIPGTVNSPDNVSAVLGKKMYDTTKALNRTMAKIRNPKAIEQFDSELTAFLNAVSEKNLLKHENFIKGPVLQYLILNTKSLPEKYALADYIFKLAQNSHISPDRSVLSLLPEDVIAGMHRVYNNDKLFTHSTIKDTGLTFAENELKILDNEFWTDAATSARITSDFAKHIENFNMCDELDKSGIFSPEKQAFAQGAQQTYKLLKFYVDLLNEAPEADAMNILHEIGSKIMFITEQLHKQTLYNYLNYTNPEDLRNRLAWNLGHVTFLESEAPEIAQQILNDKKAFEALGVVVSNDGHRLHMQIDHRAVKYECIIRNEDDRAVKHIYIDGQEILKPELPELDVGEAIKATIEEYTKSTEAGPAVLGVLNESKLKELGGLITGARSGLHNITRNASAGVHAELMDKESMRFIYNNAPPEIQKAMGDIDAMLIDNSAWFTETNFNLCNLGSTSAKRQIQENVSVNLMGTYEKATRIALSNQKARYKYLDMMLRGETRLDVGFWADEANNELVIRYLKDHPELTVAVLYKDAKAAQGYNIKRVTINTAEDLQNARRLHASVLSNQVYSKTASVVYDSAYDKGSLHFLANIMRLYKIGQLSIFNMGALARNLIDSTLKMFISTQDVLGTLRAGHDARKQYSQYKTALRGLLASSDVNTEAVERIARAYGVAPKEVMDDVLWEVNNYKLNTIKDVMATSRLFQKYNTALDEIIKTDRNAVLRPQNVEFYFKYMAKDFDIDTFYEIHKFITQGASAGMPQALKEAFQKTSPEAFQIDGLFDSVVHLLGKTAEVNGYFEQVIRLTQHIQQLRSGMNFAESNLKIVKTHFDYASKTDVTKSIELIFPYYSFKMNNYEYWANIMETQPWVMRMLSEVMEQVWEFDEYDTYAEHTELANNESLQYQILSGNVPLFHDDSATLKLNPSFMDVISMTTDPFGNATSSLWAPLNVGFKKAMLEAWNQGLTNQFVDNTFGLDQYAYDNQLPLGQQMLYNAPLVGPTIQRFTQQSDKYAERTDFLGSKYMPSLFGATSRWNTENIKSPEEWDAIHSEWANNALQRKIAYDSKRRSYSSKRKASYSGQRYYYNKSYNKYGNGTRYYNYYNPGYSDYVEYYNKPYNKRYTDRYPQKLKLQRPKRVYSENIYWKFYTKSGKKRWDILKSKATQKNLQMKIKLMYDYYR